MLSYLVRRILQCIPIWIGVTLVTFIIMNAIPGDPVLSLLDTQHQVISQEARQAIEQKWGLDQPTHIQYVRFLGNVAKGDLGTSYRTQRPVMQSLLSRFPATFKLTVLAMAFACLIGIPAGVISAAKRNSFFDTSSMLIALFGISMPVFWLGLMLMYVVSVRFGLLQPSGYSGWDYRFLVLPTITLGTFMTGIIARITRSSMLNVINMDYIITARSKGLRESVVIFRHALHNALIPVVTVVGVQTAMLLAGAVVTERVFAIPGLGQLVVDSIDNRDLPLVQGCILFFATVFIAVNLVVDAVYAKLDPRVRVGKL